MSKKVKGGTGRQESVKGVASEILEHIKELELSDENLKKVQLHCACLKTGSQKQFETYRKILTEYLETGNEVAKSYAQRLRNTIEWGSPAKKPQTGNPLEPEPMDENDIPLQHATKISLDCVFIKDIKIAEPFKSLLPIRDDVKAKISDNMIKEDYDLSQPLVLWQEKRVLVDGHTRLAAAVRANLTKVPVLRKSFKNEAAAVAYALHTQCGRRNLTDAELIDLIPKVDKLSTRGGDRRSDANESKETGVAFGRSSERTAEILGINSKKVERARRVLKNGDHNILAKVREGDITINAAYNQLTQKKSPSAEAAMSPIAAQTSTETAAANAAPDFAVAGDNAVSLEDDQSQGHGPDGEPEGMETEQTQAPDKYDHQPTVSDQSPPEPDLAGILKALQGILKMTGSNADLHARFRADIEVILEMVDKAA